MANKLDNTVLIRERIYIPVHLVNVPELKETYTTKRYEDKACINCEYAVNKHSYLCDECPAYLGEIRLYGLRTIKGRAYIGIPVGDKRLFEKKTGLLFSETTIKDVRVYAPFDYRIKFLATLRDYQVPVIKQFLEHKYGLLLAPPRTGKTLMALYIGLKLGQKMVLLANQHEFVEQFLDHIRGNEAEGIPKCTNLPELEEKYGKKLYGTPKTDADFENFQFFAMTYQAFMSEKNGKDRFNKIKNKIGTVAIDEVDKSAAAGFARVVSMFPSRYRFGVSGTINRKDGLHFITKAILGPVVAKSTREALRPTVILHDSLVNCNRSFGVGKGAWVRTMQYLSKEKNRNRLIVEWVLKDLAKGHSIVIPVQFRAHVTMLCNAINDAYGSDICEEFTGGAGEKSKAKRKETLTRAKAGKTRVVVGIRSLLQRGLNVPQWSCLYLILPISNEPNLKQETQRVCTPCEGKRTPVLRLFFDKEVGASLGCARNTLKHCAGFKYDFMKSDKQAALRLLVLGAGRQRDVTANADDAQFRATRSLFADEQPKRIPVKRL